MRTHLTCVIDARNVLGNLAPANFKPGELDRFDPVIIERLQAIYTELNNIYPVFAEHLDKISNTNNNHTMSMVDDGETKKSSGPVALFPCKCTSCRGIAMRHENRKVECGICYTEYCGGCWEPKSAMHVCKPEDKMSVDTIKSNTRACPKCATAIQRSEGCNHMFCTQCHTAFDYITGKVETGPVHNPHYFEWLQRSGRYREAADVVDPCANTADLSHRYFNQVPDMLRPTDGPRNPQWRICPVADQSIKIAEEVNWVVSDVQLRVRPSIARKIENIGLTLRDYRCKYLSNEIDDVRWKRLVQSVETRRTTLLALDNMLDTYTRILTETLGRHVAQIPLHRLRPARHMYTMRLQPTWILECVDDIRLAHEFAYPSITALTTDQRMLSRFVKMMTEFAQIRVNASEISAYID